MRILYITHDDPRRSRAAATVDLLRALGHETKAVAAATPSQARAFRPDLVLVRGIRLSTGPALLAERLELPLVVEIDGLLEDELRGPVRRRTARAVRRFTLSRAARVVAPSPELRAALSARGGLPASRVAASLGDGIRGLPPKSGV